MSNKADEQHWNRLHSTASMRAASKSDNIRLWIERQIPVDAARSRTCIEIGCCPGRYLAVLGELGYEVSGVDLAENIRLVPEWLSGKGFRVGTFWRENFLQFDFQKKFDVVMSLGFIEHFTNWREVLQKHGELVAENGYLVLEAPNFIGWFQKWLHTTLDRENYERHHPPAMDVDAWSEVLATLGFEIIYKGYFGRFDFWVEEQKRSLWQRFLLKTLNRLRKPLKYLLPADKKAYSPVGGVIARRTGMVPHLPGRIKLGGLDNERAIQAP